MQCAPVLEVTKLPKFTFTVSLHQSGLTTQFTGKNPFVMVGNNSELGPVVVYIFTFTNWRKFKQLAFSSGKLSGWIFPIIFTNNMHCVFGTCVSEWLLV